MPLLERSAASAPAGSPAGSLRALTERVASERRRLEAGLRGDGVPLSRPGAARGRDEPALRGEG